MISTYLFTLFKTQESSAMVEIQQQNAFVLQNGCRFNLTGTWSYTMVLFSVTLKRDSCHIKGILLTIKHKMELWTCTKAFLKPEHIFERRFKQLQKLAVELKQINLHNLPKPCIVVRLSGTLCMQIFFAVYGRAEMIRREIKEWHALWVYFLWIKKMQMVLQTLQKVRRGKMKTWNILPNFYIWKDFTAHTWASKGRKENMQWCTCGDVLYCYLLLQYWMLFKRNQMTRPGRTSCLHFHLIASISLTLWKTLLLKYLTETTFWMFYAYAVPSSSDDIFSTLNVE